jgi:hypothetical protein
VIAFRQPRRGVFRIHVRAIVIPASLLLGCGGDAPEPESANYCQARADAPWPAEVIASQTWKRKVHIEDFNFIDEYLGHIELCVLAHKTTSGQVYIEHAAAEKRLRGKADQLSIGGVIHASSILMKGRHFSTLHFSLWLGMPRAGGMGQVVFEAPEPGTGSLHRVPMTPSNTSSFRRSFEIVGLDTSVQVTVLDPSSFEPISTNSQMILEERLDQRIDFDNFSVEVDGKLTSYRLDSFSDD